MYYLARYSWGNYFMVIAIGLAVYFVLIGLKYFRGDLLAAVSSTRTIPDARDRTAQEENEDDDEVFGPEATIPVYKNEEEAPFEDTTDESFREVERLIGELKALIALSAKKMYDKRTLLEALKPMLARYPVVNHPAFREAVGEYIVTECRSKGAVALTEDEVDVLWVKAG